MGGGGRLEGWELAEFVMSGQEKRGREGLRLLWSWIPKGGAIIPTQRPSCGPASRLLPRPFTVLFPKVQPRPRVPRQHSPQPLST